MENERKNKIEYRKEGDYYIPNLIVGLSTFFCTIFIRTLFYIQFLIFFVQFIITYPEIFGHCIKNK